MPELDVMIERLDNHIDEDRRLFDSIRETLVTIDSKLDSLTEKVVRLDALVETSERTASRAGAISGSKWAAFIGAVVAGLANACSLVTYGGN